MKHLPLILILAFSLFLKSCNKDSDYIPLNKEFLSYFAFPQGSWWVYKEIHSGETDSFYVNSYKVENLDDRKGHRKYKYLVYQLFSDSAEAYGSTFFDGATNTYNEWSPVHSVLPRFVYPVEDSKYVNEIFTFSIPDHYDSLQVQGKWYKNVYRTENKTQLDANPYKSEYYAKNVGVIKRVYFDSSQWDLVKYYHAK